MKNKLTARNIPTAQQDAVKDAAPPLARYEGPESAYRLAFMDTDFLLREEMRPVRMQLELLKPELVQNEQGIESTVVIFGSARIVPADVAERLVADARSAGDPTALRLAQTQLAMSHYYEEARRFAALVTQKSRGLSTPVYVVTGGGPGIMEAGNRGAFDVGGKSIGLNIVLQHEQAPNPYITPELCFQFHYFGLRKMHFLMRSVALVCFPGADPDRQVAAPPGAAVRPRLLEPAHQLRHAGRDRHDQRARPATIPLRRKRRRSLGAAGGRIRFRPRSERRRQERLRHRPLRCSAT